MALPVADALARRVYDAIARRGAPIAIRRYSELSGPTAYPNPPTLNSPVVSGDTAAGVSTLTLNASGCDGRLVAGDTLTINGLTYTVTATVTARSPKSTPAGFDAIPITPALLAPVSNGTAVSFSWSADQQTYGMIQAFPRFVTDGDLIQARDLQVTVSAWGIDEPQTTWRLVILDQPDKSYAIVSKQPVYAMGGVTTWQLQAR